MPEYSITFARSARKELEKLDTKIALRIFAKIKALKTEPRGEGATKLKGPKDLWRIRVGDYRAIYEIDDTRRIVDVVIVRHRRDVYRDL